jgi:hypothetical protein
VLDHQVHHDALTELLLLPGAALLVLVHLAPPHPDRPVIEQAKAFLITEDDL